MYEFCVLIDGREELIFGYSLRNACKRFGYNINEVRVLYRTYVD